MVAAGHPLATKPVTLGRIAGVPQVAVSRCGRSYGVLDDVLADNGLIRTSSQWFPRSRPPPTLLRAPSSLGLCRPDMPDTSPISLAPTSTRFRPISPHCPCPRPGTSATTSTPLTHGSGARSGPRSPAPSRAEQSRVQRLCATAGGVAHRPGTGRGMSLPPPLRGSRLALRQGGPPATLGGARRGSPGTPGTRGGRGAR